MAKDKQAVARARTRAQRDAESGEARTPPWFVPVMLGFILVGLLWIVVYYLSQSTLPIESIGAWNIAIGFGIMFIGFLMTTRWR